MNINITVRQLTLGMTELQQLCGGGSGRIESLAYSAGGNFLPGEKVAISVAASLNMLIRSITANHGVEVQTATAWLPGLRSEALFHLGQSNSNWSFHGSSDAERQFWPMFHGEPDSVRPRIASLLGCYSTETTRELRFYSQNDVEELSNFQYEQQRDERAPRFVIDAHSLAGKIQAVCGAPLFFATV